MVQSFRRLTRALDKGLKIDDVFAMIRRVSTSPGSKHRWWHGLLFAHSSPWASEVHEAAVRPG
jgi:hypothetical protein